MIQSDRNGETPGEIFIDVYCMCMSVNMSRIQTELWCIVSTKAARSARRRKMFTDAEKGKLGNEVQTDVLNQRMHQHKLKNLSYTARQMSFQRSM